VSHLADILTIVASVLELLKKNKVAIDALVKRHHGVSVSVFGSIARGEETGSSDIDFLVTFKKGSSLFDVLHLQEDLETLLGRKVDVLSAGGLKNRDDHILSEAVLI